MLLSEEARESHIHILGAPGEGKSKLIEHLVRDDVDRGYGACVLDPSDNGDTAYKILKYCCEKGFEKVILIDPRDLRRLGVVPTINPFRYYTDTQGKVRPDPASVGNITDTIRVLWGSGRKKHPRSINTSPLF